MKLIVNADDFNLTEGINETIFECFERGRLTSTTVMINRPLRERNVKLLKSLKSRVGIGLHLNITFGEPLSNLEKIPSLINNACFKRCDDYRLSYPNEQDILCEWSSQVECFKKVFGFMPTHLDTHHQLHDDIFFLKPLLSLSKSSDLPIRRSALFNQNSGAAMGCSCTDELWGSLNIEDYWTPEVFQHKIQNSAAETVELMTHPGRVDAELEDISSMTISREKDAEFLLSRNFADILETYDVTLIHYGELEKK